MFCFHNMQNWNNYSFMLCTIHTIEHIKLYMSCFVIRTFNNMYHGTFLMPAFEVRTASRTEPSLVSMQWVHYQNGIYTAQKKLSTDFNMMYLFEWA